MEAKMNSTIPILDPDHSHGYTADLDGTATTMWPSAYKCGCGHTRIYESKFKIYCYSCGVFWDKDKIKINGHGY